MAHVGQECRLGLARILSRIQRDCQSLFLLLKLLLQRDSLIELCLLASELGIRGLLFKKQLCILFVLLINIREEPQHYRY